MSGFVALLTSFIPLIVIGLTIQFDRRYSRPGIAGTVQKAIAPAAIAYLIVVAIHYLIHEINWSLPFVVLFAAAMIRYHYVHIEEQASNVSPQSKDPTVRSMSIKEANWLRRSTAALLLSSFLVIAMSSQ